MNKKLPKIFIIFIFFILEVNLIAQNEKLKSGIYLNFQNFKNNNPLPIEKICFEKKAGLFLIDNLVNNDKFTFVDDSGFVREFYTKNIWGFYENGNIYIKRNREFFKIIYVGKISFFISKIQTVMSEQLFEMSPYKRIFPNEEFKQYLLDFETGQVYDFNEKNLEKLLANDTLLYNEFKSLSKKQKKQLKFYYIRRYNEKHPLPFLFD